MAHVTEPSWGTLTLTLALTLTPKSYKAVHVSYAPWGTLTLSLALSLTPRSYKDGACHQTFLGGQLLAIGGGQDLPLPGIFPLVQVLLLPAPPPPLTHEAALASIPRRIKRKRIVEHGNGCCGTPRRRSGYCTILEL